MGGRSSTGNRNQNIVPISEFGRVGVYEAYRSGGIFDSPLGFLSFGLEERQSEVYSNLKSMPIESYRISINNPLVLTGSDFDKMQENLTQRYVGKSYLEGATLKEQQAIMKQAAEAVAREGYDSILMDKVNKLSGKHTYEIGLLNSKKSQASQSRRRKK